MNKTSSKRSSRRCAVLVGIVASAVLLGGCLFGGGGGGAHSLSVFQLQPGDCLNPPSAITAQLTTVTAISCKAPHTQEIFALVKDPGPQNYPGAQSLQTYANAKCLQYFAPYVGIAYQHSSLFYTYLLPSVRSWEAGDQNRDLRRDDNRTKAEVFGKGIKALKTTSTCASNRRSAHA